MKIAQVIHQHSKSNYTIFLLEYLKKASVLPDKMYIELEEIKVKKLHKIRLIFLSVLFL